MNIVLNNTKSNYFEIFSLEDLDNVHETFRKFFSIKGPIEAKILSINESISIHQLSKLKNHLHNLNVFSLCIYSNDRNTILAGKSLRINSTFLKEQEVKNKLLLFNSKEKTIFFTKEQSDLVTEYLQMETFALLEMLIQEP